MCMSVLFRRLKCAQTMNFLQKKRLSLLNIHEEQLELEMKSHVYPLYPAPIIMKGADSFELDVAKFGIVPSWAKELKFGRVKQLPLNQVSGKVN